MHALTRLYSKLCRYAKHGSCDVLKVQSSYPTGKILFLTHNSVISICLLLLSKGWSGGAMVLGKLPVPGRPKIWITVGQGPSALAVGTDGGGFDVFTLIYPSFLILPLFGRRPDID